MSAQSNNPFEAIGGKDVIDQLVESFYSKVQKHPLLTPIFPDDLTETARVQKQFLTQFLGGPTLYSDEHGHPMLRARHMPFPITPQRAHAWLQCMNEAMTDIGLEGPVRDYVFERLTQTAHHMINTST
ncbi:globin [Anaerobacillus alkalidiazotrophicus]|uniref:Globin n=1 Tax=Anaerobacillus alkalidiazotrophicus TaxID=472963 RepID=A0A1S2M1L2_9BACI|nr:globin [Anaerobacillus alkalidiazotrophicus]OIJ18504.1 globin [Anaerobacillus alkalidiazotrophicus]OIJ19983.1 globin [Anaerobacillus alkalidiazotrophicus]